MRQNSNVTLQQEEDQRRSKPQERIGGVSGSSGSGSEVKVGPQSSDWLLFCFNDISDFSFTSYNRLSPALPRVRLWCFV